jgi:signal transduction histidine kinase/ligand-binding sensor domain-containing protein
MLSAHEPGPSRTERSIAQYTLEVWNTERGLPQNSVSCITQTGDGYIWLGTQEGIVRFDGVRFTTFDKHNTPAIKNNYITALHVDRKKRLWIGTYDGGVLSYAEGAFTPLDLGAAFEKAHIRSIYEDRSGCLWIAVRDQGVVCLANGVRHIFNESTGLADNQVWALCEDDDGRMWIGTEEGISIVENGALRSFTTKNGLISNAVNALCPGAGNTMWIGTNLGVMQVPSDRSDPSRYRSFTVDHHLPDRIVKSLAVDEMNRVWIGTRSGAALLSNGFITSFTTADGLSFDHVSSVFIDREQNVWIGTEGGGINVMREGLFSTYTTRQGLPSDGVWTIFEDAAEQLWVGTDKGLIVLDHDRSAVLERYTTANGLHDNEVYSVSVDRNGAVWVGTVNGLNIIKNGKVRDIAPLSRTKDQIFGCVMTDSKNRVWAGTTGNGILMFENSAFRTAYTTTQGLAGNYINTIVEDRNGNIWVGTDGDGISVIGDSGIVSYSTEHGLPNNFIHTIHVDSHNVIWIGTFGDGLARWKEGRFTSLSTRQGLFNDGLFRIMEDDYGRMWFTSNRGIFHIEKSELDQCLDGLRPSVTSVTHGKEDGLKTTEFNGGVQPAGWKAHDGSLWFPTSKGAATIHPASIHKNQQPPLVVFEELRINNQTILSDNGAMIPTGTERYEFRFTGLSFANPSNVTFKVKLDGYDKNWDDIGTRRSAFYTHLPSGSYTFYVMAANSDGVWSERAAAFTFVRQAYFYETSVFFFGMTAVVLVGFYMAYRLRVRSIHRRSRELEHLVDARTKDLNDALEETERQRTIAEKANQQKTQLLDMVAHDLKTPLVSVSVFIKELQHMTALNDRAKEDLQLIQKSTERMIALITDLLNLSSIESGHFRMQKETVNLVELAGITVDGLRMLSERKGQMLYYLPSAADECNIVADSARMQEAVENLINNAVKYSPIGSEIVVSVEKSGDIARFWVRDNGPGISHDDQRLLFKKFQILSAKPTANENATGLGLAIAKEIVQAHGGTIFVESEPGKGSRFVIELKAV